ncbi:MAG: TrbI/VirB10 family protein [Candidatus Omnitrophica bacterium]|nr:TrbI/VirB10 family protein [Candidatus Omnitrophota bacterium]
MKVIDVLFKKNHTGKRIPTLLTWGLIALGVFAACFVSQDEKVVKNEEGQAIINRQEITAVSIADKDVFKKSEDVITPLLRSDYKKKVVKKKAKPKDNQKDNKHAKKKRVKEKIPLGSMVECMLIHNIVTNNFSAPVIVQVVDDFYFNNVLLLPKDTRIYGEARSGRERDRVLVAFKTIVLHDGTEVSIKSRGLNADGSGGIQAIIINRQNKKKIMSKIVNFFSGVFLGFQEKTTNAITGVDQVALSSRNAILEGSAQTFKEEAKRMRNEIKKAAGYGIIVAGERLIVYFDQSADVNGE